MQAVLDMPQSIVHALAAGYRQVTLAQRDNSDALGPVIDRIAATHGKLPELGNDVVNTRRLDDHKVLVALDNILVKLWRHEK